MRFRVVKALALAATLATASVGVVSASAADGNGAMVLTRRLTESQYKHTIADVFGPDIKINGRFEPERREEGLLAIGATKLSISGAGFDQYYGMAKAIADQAFDDRRRDRTTSCKPADPKKVDERCVDEFVRQYGLKLFRRPLTDAEVKSRIAAAVKGGNAQQSHVVGMKLALTSLLIAPDFLFRVERGEPSSRRGKPELDDYSRAARLSFLLWDTAPDEELLRAAAAGELDKPAGLKKQVDRLMASPKLEQGVRAFFADMLQFEYFDTVTKDVGVYPKFSAALMEGAREQTLRTLVNHLLKKNGDYRDIFTTRETEINRWLASVYNVPFVSATEWAPYTVPADKESAGVVTQVTFLSLFSHPGRSSPTKRGVALNEVFLCTPTPNPPPNVDFSIVNDTGNTLLKTVRARLLAHATDETCAGCHNLSDPIGLSLERFDSLGQYRTQENGELIDVSAELEGKKFTGATGLGKVLHDEPRVTECLVRNVFAYGAGRAPGEADGKFLETQTAAFAKDGYRLPALLRRMATSREFYSVTPEQAPPAPPAKVASAQPIGGLQ